MVSVTKGGAIECAATGLVPAALHVRHIARSVDRLLTEGQLREAQLAALRSERESGTRLETLFSELEAALVRGSERVLALKRRMAKPDV
jgi:alpha-D-ribose 1-methylphosphonate 5-triphosphate synthase subunit PhnI